MNKLTAFTIWNQAEGVRASLTYSTINDSGEITADNQKKDIIVLDSKQQEAIELLRTAFQTVIDSGTITTA
jgi:hypothetical protein